MLAALHASSRSLEHAITIYLEGKCHARHSYRRAQAAKPSICSAQPLTQSPPHCLVLSCAMSTAAGSSSVTNGSRNPSANLECLNAAVSAIEELQVQVRDIKEKVTRRWPCCVRRM